LGEPDYNFLDPKLDRFYDWMLQTFNERNFTNRGLVEMLRSCCSRRTSSCPDAGSFPPRSARACIESRLSATDTPFPPLYCLGSALDYIEATPGRHRHSRRLSCEADGA
jgi:hypothetical protein